MKSGYFDTKEKSISSRIWSRSDPSYTKGTPHIGRASYFVPDCALGRGEAAYRTACEILPDNPELENCGVEPYAMTNMYLGTENPYCAKFAPWSWITGTAGWMYRRITEYLLGVQATFNGLRIKLCIPAQPDGTKISRQYRQALSWSNLVGAVVNGTFQIEK